MTQHLGFYGEHKALHAVSSAAWASGDSTKSNGSGTFPTYLPSYLPLIAYPNVGVRIKDIIRARQCILGFSFNALLHPDLTFAVHFILLFSTPTYSHKVTC